MNFNVKDLIKITESVESNYIKKDKGSNFLNLHLLDLNNSNYLISKTNNLKNLIPIIVIYKNRSLDDTPDNYAEIKNNKFVQISFNNHIFSEKFVFYLWKPLDELDSEFTVRLLCDLSYQKLCIKNNVNFKQVGFYERF
jgi:hypothetical protein